MAVRSTRMRSPKRVAAFSLYVCVSFAGCTSDHALQSSAIHRRTMPTINPPTTMLAPAESESELLARASRLALSGDFPTALSALSVHRTATESGRLEIGLVTGLAATKPTVAARVAVALPSGPTQTAAFEIVARALVTQNPSAATEWALQYSDSVLAPAIRQAIGWELGRESAHANFARIKLLPASPARNHLLGETVAGWASYEENAPLSAVDDFPDGELRKNLTTRVAFQIAQRDPLRALTVAASLPAGRDRWIIFSAAAQTWIALDPSAAMAWAQGLPAGAARDAAFAGIDTGLGGAARRPASVAPRLSTGRSPVIGGSTATAIIAESETSIPSFANWLATQSRPMTRDEAVLEFIRQRGATDAGAIGNWITTLPGGTTRQQAIEIYFDQLLRSSPSAAADWLRTIPGEDRHDDMIERTVRQWLQTDPRSAEIWLRDSPIPAHRREELLRNVPRL